MTEALFTAPLYLIVRKDKKTGDWKKDYINLNNYHNWHPQVRNRLKIAYAQNVRSQVSGERFDQIEVEYTLYRGSARKGDRMNPLSVHDKFFLDALKECGVIPEDNDEVVAAHRFKTGPIDRENPRVEIRVIAAKVEKLSTGQRNDL